MDEQSFTKSGLQSGTHLLSKTGESGLDAVQDDAEVIEQDYLASEAGGAVSGRAEQRGRQLTVAPRVAWTSTL